MKLRAENLCKSYQGKVVLEDVSIELDEGTFCGVLGGRGSGKTTLLRILAGIEKPDSGKVYYGDQDVTGIPVQRRSIAFVYQQFVNYPSMTVFENIASPLRVSTIKRTESEIEAKVQAVAEMLRLQDILHHLPEQISGGQQQRCAIARALVKEAHFTFLDAPLVNLDYKLREGLRGELKQVFGGDNPANSSGVVVYATPEPIDALMMASHVAFLHQGRLLQFGDVQDVYQNPVHASVASYFCHPPMNLIDCTVETELDKCVLRASTVLQVDPGIDRSRFDEDQYLLGIRPHHLSLEKEHDRMIPFSAKVELAEVVGSNTELHLVHENLRVNCLLGRVERFSVGDTVTSYLDPSEAYLFSKATGRFVAKTD